MEKKGLKTQQFVCDKYYIQMPIVLQALLTPAELVVFNTIVHFSDLGERYISKTMFQAYTGLNDKTIGKVLSKLEEMRIINKGKRCICGTNYNVETIRLTKIVNYLNASRNPVERLRVADKIRGEGNSIHTYAINALSNTAVDNRK